MALPWVRLDSAFPQNPKILMLAEDKKWQSIAVYIGGLAYSGAQGTDGFLPTSCLLFIHGSKKNATDLCTVGLWMARPGGWDINGWAEFQPSTEENQARSKKARLAAEERWRRHREREETP